jgi:hypothetical protein
MTRDQERELMRKDLENLTRQLCEKYEALRSVAILVDDVSTPLSPHPGYVWGDTLGDPREEDLESLRGMVTVAARFYTVAAETFARACRDKINERVIYLETLRKKVASEIERSDLLGEEILAAERRLAGTQKEIAAARPEEAAGGSDSKEAAAQQSGADQIPG